MSSEITHIDIRNGEQRITGIFFLDFKVLDAYNFRNKVFETSFIIFKILL